MRQPVLASVLLLIACGCASAPQPGVVRASFHPAPRMVAEWEPALGALVTWPLTVPHALVVELARDGTLYALVADEQALSAAVDAFEGWGIDLGRVEFLTVPQGRDRSWVRDWGPHGVFDSKGALQLADARYRYATPVSGPGCDDPLSMPGGGAPGSTRWKAWERAVIADDSAPRALADALGLGHVELPCTLTGGNAMTDGRGTLLASCILANENRLGGVPEDQLEQLLRETLGIERLNLLPNFEERGIQHVDCLFKLLDEETLLVLRPPGDHPASGRYQRIVDAQLTHLRTPYDRPYRILRIDTARYSGDKLAAYTNSLILNETVYVPLFGIEQDAVALEQWSEALPGYSIKGFPFVIADEPALCESTKMYGALGWDAGDALHCRTRAVWDPEMLYVSVRQVPDPLEAQVGYRVAATIIDYSGAGLVTDELRLYWRVRGDPDWSAKHLQAAPGDNQFDATIAHAFRPGQTCEYYVAAADHSGRRETRPRTAPEGLYSFTIRRPDPTTLKVFLLAGQSNMEGQAVVDLDHEEYYNGGRGILTRVLEDPALAKRFGRVRAPDGSWAVRDDVHVWYRTEAGETKARPLSIGLAGYADLHHFGPELMFGHVLGDHLDEPVLLVKAAWGGKSLMRDFRPPGAGEEVGAYYPRIQEELREGLARRAELFPELAGLEPELAGFVWFQGWNDMIDASATAEYEDNLVHLVEDLRNDLGEPELRVVIAETGNCNNKQLRRAQASAARRVGGVFVPTEGFLRAPENSPNTGHGHHWYGNAESYLLIGEALGEAMKGLMQQR